MNKLACKICGFEGRRMDTHVKGKHGMSVADYKLQFPGVTCISLSSKDSMNRLHADTEVHNHLVSSLQAGLQVRWTKTESHALASKTASDWWTVKENRELGAKQNKEKADNQWQTMGDNLARRISDAQVRYRIHYVDIHGRNLTLKSRWELAFAYLMDASNIQYAYEPDLLHWVDSKGKNRRYFPDFKLREPACYVEVKGFVVEEVLTKIATSDSSLPIILIDREAMTELGLLDLNFRLIHKDMQVSYDMLISSQAWGVIPMKVQRLAHTVLEQGIMKCQERGASSEKSLMI